MAREALFDRDITLAITGAEKEVQKLFAEEIRKQLAEAKRDSRPSDFDQFVDRVLDKPIEQVDPFGVASFEFSYGREVVEFALAVLRSISPVESGEYQREHKVFLDGHEVADLSTLGTAKRVVIANTVPYARRLEMPTKWKSGELKGQPRGWSIQPQVPQPPDSIYKHAQRTVNRRYGNIMKAKYTWVGLDADEGEEIGGPAGNRPSNRYPALVLRNTLAP